MFPFAIPCKARGIQSKNLNFIIFELCRFIPAHPPYINFACNRPGSSLAGTSVSSRRLPGFLPSRQNKLSILHLTGYLRVVNHLATLLYVTGREDWYHQHVLILPAHPSEIYFAFQRAGSAVHPGSKQTPVKRVALFYPDGETKEARKCWCFLLRSRAKHGVFKAKN